MPFLKGGPYKLNRKKLFMFQYCKNNPKPKHNSYKTKKDFLIFYILAATPLEVYIWGVINHQSTILVRIKIFCSWFAILSVFEALGWNGRK